MNYLDDTLNDITCAIEQAFRLNWQSVNGLPKISSWSFANMYKLFSSVSENYLTCVAFMATSIFGTAFPSKVIYVHFSRHNSCWTDPLWWYRKSSKPSWPKWTIPSLPPQVPHLAATRWLAGRLLTDLAPKKALFLKDLTPLVSEEVKLLVHF